MQTIKGIPASGGFASGPAFWLVADAISVPRHEISDPVTEWKRLESALESARVQMAHLVLQAQQQEIGQEEVAIFEAHQLFLEDPELLDLVRSKVQAEGQNVEAAWVDGIESYAMLLQGMESEYFAARAADVRDVGRRVTRILLGLPEADLSQLINPSVILAHDLTPSDTVRLDKKRVLAFCTAEGGPTSHTAILARSLGLPAIVGAGTQLMEVPAGTQLLVNGEKGELTLNPDEKALAEFSARSSGFQARLAEELGRAGEPALTLDGRRVEVVANIGGVEDARTALRNGAEGVGLFRTEFLYLDRSLAPDEEEQYGSYAAVIEVMGDRPVVVRTMDIGGDKELPYLDLGDEANPFLGCRAIRISLQEPEIFKVQLRALLRAACGHDMRIMFPMISNLGEVRQARVLLQEACGELEARGICLPGRVQVGIMVEIPSVVVMADQFAKEVDFFSVGTNDLTQYTFAAERTNPRVAHLADACHPAILRQLQTVFSAAHNAGIWSGVCGELAGDPDAIPLLLGLGLDEFSMAGPAIPRAKTILRKWSQDGARSLALQALQLDSGEAVRTLVRSAQPQ